MAAVMQRLMQAANAALSVGTCERPSTPADGTASNSRAAVHGDTKLDAGPALQPTKQQRKSGQPTQEDVDQHESLADGHDASRGQHGDAAAATVTSPDLPTPAQPLLQQHTRYAANSVQEANGASTFPPPSVRPSTLMLVADAYNQHTTSTVPAALKADAARPTLSSHPGRSMLTRTPITPFSSAPAQPQSPTQAAEVRQRMHPAAFYHPSPPPSRVPHHISMFPPALYPPMQMASEPRPPLHPVLCFQSFFKAPSSTSKEECPPQLSRYHSSSFKAVPTFTLLVMVDLSTSNVLPHLTPARHAATSATHHLATSSTPPLTCFPSSPTPQPCICQCLHADRGHASSP